MQSSYCTKIVMAEEYFNCYPSLRTLSSSQSNLSRCRATTYPADVTENDLTNMALSGKNCKKINDKVLRHTCEPETMDLQMRVLRKNATFLVKSENSQLYSSGLQTQAPLALLPHALCPDTSAHLQLLESLPLSVACPTCWSVQRVPAKTSGSDGGRHTPSY